MCASVLTGCGGQSPETRDGGAASAAAAPWQYRGVNYATWWHDSFEAQQSDTALGDLATTGANCLALVVTEYLNDATSSVIRRDPQRTPTVRSVRHAIRVAHGLGLQVMLKPHVDCKDGSFRGAILPAEKAAWRQSYADFIGRWAAEAQAGGAELFCVGTELTSMTRPGDQGYWRGLIQAVRQTYGYTGRLTYAANYDAYQAVTFWDALDLAGVDGYFRMPTATVSPSQNALRQAWGRLLPKLRTWQAEHGKPVVFTELGYASVCGCTGTPYDPPGGPYSDLCQANAYAAALEVLAAEGWVAGVLLWDWEPFAPIPQAPGPTRAMYTPQDKPAQDILSAAFGGVPPPNGADRTLFGFERSALRWVPQLADENRGIRSVAASRVRADQGSGSLELRCDLAGKSEQRKKGEAYVDLRWLGIGSSFHLQGRDVTCRVYCPPGSRGDPNAPNGLQLFVKDDHEPEWRSLYGDWENIIDGAWNELSLRVGRAKPPEGHIDPGFDPSHIVAVGVKVGINANSTGSLRNSLHVDSLQMEGIASADDLAVLATD
jgi:hypothetical protein